MARAASANINGLIQKNIKSLSEQGKKEILSYIEYIKLKEDPSFIQYVNNRTKEAVEAKKKGERFISLEELQREYA